MNYQLSRFAVQYPERRFGRSLKTKPETIPKQE
jgi:hypothetical protein